MRRYRSPIRGWIRLLMPHLVIPNPSLLAHDRRPGLKSTFCTAPWVPRDRMEWTWLANAATHGEPQARERDIPVCTRMRRTCDANMSRFYIYDVSLPAAISGFLRSAEHHPYFHGNFGIISRQTNDVNQSAPIGRVRMSSAESAYGLRANIFSLA